VRLIDRLRRRLREQDGIVMLYALGAMMIVLASSVAAFAAVDGDIPLTVANSNQKQAYAAAQAGIQRYLFDLNQNSEFWTQCVPAGSNWIYNPGDTVVPAPVPGSSTETYAVTLLPAVGQSVYTKCSTADPVDSMIQQSGDGAGSFRISSTGWAGNLKRTIVAAFREQSFLDYSYFTMYETSDPNMQVDEAYANNSRDATIEPPSQCTGNCGSNYAAAVAGAQTQCTQYRPQRDSDNAAGYGNGVFFGDSYGRYGCDDIEFASQDQINGPFHTNDSVLYCGGATFGRAGHGDSVEIGTSPQFVEAAGCSGPPNTNGVAVTSSRLEIPQTNTLATIADAAQGYLITGTTCLTLEAGDILVGKTSSAHPSCEGGSPPPTTTMSYPSNGVLYVKNGACSLTYDVEDPSYTGNTGCGTVYVHGVDGPPLTIGSDNDIVIDGDLTYASASTSMLGLIATNFVRIYHPVGNQPLGSNTGGCDTSMANSTGTPYNVTVDAMILSLDHSFVVDQYDCGNRSLGTLTLLGGIAQKYRGTVGTGTPGNAVTGYIKNYQYDDRLRYEEPPHFLTPVEGAWKIERQTECDAATGCG
jgi:hypothetical protein